MRKKFPTKSQWWQFLKSPHKILTKGEIISFFIFLFIFLFSGIFLAQRFYYKFTFPVPARGGRLVEGVVGSPHFINPLYAESNDVDRDLVELIFCGLMKYNLKGEIVPDLIKEYKILNEGKVYEVTLKDNIFWSDGKKITADDVLFTIESIQDPKTKSPLLANWVGVKVEKIDDKRLKFELKQPYSFFLERLTLKIIPKHIWENVLPENFPFSDLNLNPVGCGPYKIKNIEKKENGKISSLNLTLNEKYFGKLPFIEEISFKFFDTEKDLLLALQKKEIDSAILENLDFNLTGFNEYSFIFPRYFAVFFNLKKKENEKENLLLEKEVRLALALATDKKEILDKVLKKRGEIVLSPLLPNFYHFSPPTTTFEFDLEKAKEVLKKANFKEKEGKMVKIVKKEPAFLFEKDLKLHDTGEDVKKLQECLAKDPQIYPLKKIDGNFDLLTKQAVIRFQKKYKKEISQIAGYEIKCTGYVGRATRKKLNEICFPIETKEIPLEFTLTTVSHPILKETAFLLKKQWEKIGAKVKIEILSQNDLEKKVFKEKNFEVLLFGQILGMMPDPFPFWHSSQRELGLNISNYKNEKVDELIEKARKEFSLKERKKIYEKIQKEIIEDLPAIFLYNFPERYFVINKIKGVKGGLVLDPSKRFSEIENWYLITKRVWKLKK